MLISSSNDESEKNANEQSSEAAKINLSEDINLKLNIGSFALDSESTHDHVCRVDLITKRVTDENK